MVYRTNPYSEKIDEGIVCLAIDRQIEYRMITPESKDKKPWGDQEFDKLVVYLILLEQFEDL